MSSVQRQRNQEVQCISEAEPPADFCNTRVGTRARIHAGIHGRNLDVHHGRNGMILPHKAVVSACGAWMSGTQSRLSGQGDGHKVVESQKLTEAQVRSCCL